MKTYTIQEAIDGLRFGVSRKVTRQTVTAFLTRQRCIVGNTATNGDALYLHGNKIAEWRDGEAWITDAGWQTMTTRERLNGLLPGRRLHSGGGERDVNPNGSVGRGHTIWDGRDERAWGGEWMRTGVVDSTMGGE